MTDEVSGRCNTKQVQRVKRDRHLYRLEHSPTVKHHYSENKVKLAVCLNNYQIVILIIHPVV